MRAQGKTESEIADALQIKRSTVTSMETKHRQRYQAATAQLRYAIQIPAPLYDDLQREGMDRRMTTPVLIAKLLSTIARDKLYTALLDD